MTQPRTNRSVDGFVARKLTRPTPIAVAIARTAPATKLLQPVPQRPAFRRPATAATQPKPRRRIAERLQLPLIIFGAMVAGIFAQSVLFGELLVVAYGIAAFVWHIPSRTTFTLAVLAMVATTLLLVVRGNIALAQNFATYTFLLLVVGVIALIGELKKRGGRIYSSRKNSN